MKRNPEISSYDSKCFDLAKSFLSDEPSLDTFNNAARLATHIQLTIEEWLEYEREQPK